jgi:SulP family sulfate permease
VRGVQASTGTLLLIEGVRFMLGSGTLQKAQGSAEPFLTVASLGPVPIGIVLGILSVALIFLFLENRVLPAGILIIVMGAASGVMLGAHRQLAGFDLSLNLPGLLPYGLPELSDIVVCVAVLALPQIPMTVGNAVIAQADLTREYFGEPAARRSSWRALSFSIGLACVISAMIGGMPMCHGAGGLAAHYRFGARTAGSNVMIGAVFLIAGIVLGPQAVHLFSLIPFSVLGALLLFAGSQLALMVIDVKKREDMFVVVLMLGLTLATNLAVSFLAGIVLAYLFKYFPAKISV